MKVFRIDHSEGFSKGRTDLDSIENILKQTNHELGDIEKKIRSYYRLVYLIFGIFSLSQHRQHLA